MLHINVCCCFYSNTYIYLPSNLDMENEVLRNLGLSETETKVYLALLSLGNAQAGEITSKAEINRTNVYDALERLLSKGLVTYVKSGKIKIFEAVNPSRLKEILKEKEEELDKVFNCLEKRYKESKQKEEVTIYKGKIAVKNALDDLLKEKKEILVYGAQSKFSEIFPVYRNIWESRRQQLKIPKKILYNELVRKEKIKEKQKFSEIKFLSKEYEFSSSVLISGNKTTTIVWLEQPFAFVVNSKEVTQSNKNFFDLLWKIAKK